MLIVVMLIVYLHVCCPIFSWYMTTLCNKFNQNVHRTNKTKKVEYTKWIKSSIILM